MSKPTPPGTREEDAYRAGWLAGYDSRQLEVDQLDALADRLYRAAYADERCIRADVELDQRRSLGEPPREVTRSQALASWGIEEEQPAGAPKL